MATLWAVLGFIAMIGAQTFFVGVIARSLSRSEPVTYHGRSGRHF